MASVRTTVPTLTVSGRRRPIGEAEIQCGGAVQLAKSRPSLSCSKLKPLQSRMPVLHATRVQATSVICAAALNARCGASFQTQTITRQSSTITSAPMRGNEMSPTLDGGGVGLPPRDVGGGGGDGGGRWGGWSGGFFFFGLLALIAFFREKETGNEESRERRRLVT